MRIVDVRVLPFEAGGTIGTQPYRRTHAALKVVTDEGLTGISRVAPAAAKVIEQVFTPVLAGQDPANVERLWEAMHAAAHRAGGAARTAVGVIGSLDVALWDLLGKAVDRPVWQLLGGLRDRVEVYADSIPLPPGRETPEALAETLAGYARRGFPAVKLHLQRWAPDEVAADVALVRAAIGPRTRLMLDVHRHWDPWTAVEIARRLEPQDVFWIEEPVGGDDQPGALAFVAARVRQLVAGGEGEHSLHACREYLVHRAVQVYQADLLGAGGFTGGRRIAALADAFHVKVAPHGASFPELNAHLVASLRNGLAVPAWSAGEAYEVWSRLYAEPIQMQGGALQLSHKPGLGLELDEAFLRRHAA
jgi:L-alanine-DL-glutamate epimerase-like enolase superfamily enzyme